MNGNTNRMKYWQVGLLFLIAFILQPTLLNVISIRGYTPNLILCLVIIFTFLYDEEVYGIVFGAFFGLLYDVMYGSVVGPTPISLVLAAVLVLFFRIYANIENVINMWAVSVVAMVSYYFLNWGLYHIAGNPIGIRFVFDTVPWITLYSIVVITLMYRILLRKINRHHKDRYFK